MSRAPFGFSFDFAIPVVNRRAGKIYDPDASALFSRMTAQLSKDDKAAINQFFVTMKSDGTFGQCDCIYFNAGFNAADGLLNWRQNAYNLDNGSAIPNVFKTRRGYTGATNTTTRLDSGFNPTTAPGCKYAQNSAFMAVYIPTVIAGTNRPPIGSQTTGGNQALIIPQYTDGSVYVRINSNNAVGGGGAVASRVGLTAGSRGGATDMRVYKNGVKLATSNAASLALANQNFYVGATNVDGAVQGSADQISFAAWGGNLTDAQHATLNTAVTTFLNYLWAKYETETWNYLDQIASDVQLQTAYGSASYADWYDADWIKPLKATGIWQRGDKFHLLANYDAQAAQRNAIKPLGPLAPVNAPIFTRDRGYTGNGTSSYLTDGVQAAISMVNGSQNNNSIGAYINTSRTTGNNTSCVWGSHSAHNVYPMLTAPLVHRARTCDSGVGPNIPMAVGNAKGFALGNRRAANSNRYIKNGVLVQDPGEASVGGFTTQVHMALALSNGAAIHFSTDRVAFVWSGASLTDQQEVDFNSIAVNALTKIGAQAA